MRPRVTIAAVLLIELIGVFVVPGLMLVGEAPTEARSDFRESRQMP